MSEQAPHRRTQLIVIEGPDRVGKETQSKMLEGWLKSRGYKTARVEVPYNDGFTYRLIYGMLKNGMAKSRPDLFQTIQVLNRIIYQTFVLPWLENDYDFIIFDRWHLSAEVYGEASGVDSTLLTLLCKFISKVDLSFVLVGKAHSAEGRDVYEKDTEFQTEVRRLYNEYAGQDPSCIIINAEDSIAGVHESIISYLQITQRI